VTIEGSVWLPQRRESEKKGGQYLHLSAFRELKSDTLRKEKEEEEAGVP